jgi:hypothetical protein
MVSFTPRPLYPQEKSFWYPLDMRLGGSQSQSGRGGEEKNSQPLPGLELLIIQAVAQRHTAELCGLIVNEVWPTELNKNIVTCLRMEFPKSDTCNFASPISDKDSSYLKGPIE